jgi:hypothetical protein
MDADGRGVFYVATGERFRTQARGAVGFLRRTNPGLRVTVFTDDVRAFADADGVDALPVPEPRYSFIDKIHGFLHAPYERSVFLDTDTYVAADVSDLFRLLDRFELAACHAPGHSGARMHPYEPPDLPAAFPQLNTGVVAVRRTPRTRAVIERWRDIYAANPHHRHDQPALREAVYRSDVAVHALPPEYNFLVGHAYLSGPVRIIHSAALGAKGAEQFARALNHHTGPRVFVPPDRMFAMPT